MRAMIRTFAVAAALAAVFAVPAYAGVGDEPPTLRTMKKAKARPTPSPVRDTAARRRRTPRRYCVPSRAEPVTLKSTVLGLHRSHLTRSCIGRGRSAMREDRLTSRRAASPVRLGQDKYMHIETKWMLQLGSDIGSCPASGRNRRIGTRAVGRIGCCPGLLAGPPQFFGCYGAQSFAFLGHGSLRADGQSSTVFR